MTAAIQLLDRRALLRFAAFGLVLGVALSLLPAEPASAAKRVRKNYFGMTLHNPETWPDAPIGAVRLWDSGVTWRHIEASRGAYDFTRLDGQVTAARRQGARVLIVLGQTPSFHAKKPRAAGLYGDGASSMPRLKAWRKYVSKVVQRYKGRGVDYQVWNEANVGGFWSGTTGQMARLTKLTYKIVNRNDRKAKVVGPALATRLTGQRKWLREFYAERTGGRRVAGWMDVVSLNLYPLSNDGPETSMTLLRASKIMLRNLGVRKPIWNTEINYGLQTGGGGTARKISGKRQASNVVRTYLLNAAEGVQRVFWYSWEQQALANTRMSYRNGGLAPAGKAYRTVVSWLRNGRLTGCSRDGRGTYTCTIKYSKGVRRVYWNPSRKVAIRTPRSTTYMENFAGSRSRIRSNTGLVINRIPKMVRSRR
jgi:hypothetical protein